MRNKSTMINALYTTSTNCSKKMKKKMEIKMESHDRYSLIVLCKRN